MLCLLIHFTEIKETLVRPSRELTAFSPHFLLPRPVAFFPGLVLIRAPFVLPFEFLCVVRVSAGKLHSTIAFCVLASFLVALAAAAASCAYRNRARADS